MHINNKFFRMPSGDKPMVVKIKEPLPFECSVSATRRTCGFYVGGEFYSKKDDLLHERVNAVPFPGAPMSYLQCYLDIYGRKLVFCHAHVPHFDEYDRMYDNRFSEYFCFVDDFESLNPYALVEIFGNSRNYEDFSHWFVYDDIKNFDKALLEKIMLDYDDSFSDIEIHDPNFSTINLHIHTAESESEDNTPYSIVTMLKWKGVTTFAITDHDAIEGNIEAAELAKRFELTHINGIELTCSFAGGELGLNKTYSAHILGYGFDFDLMQSKLSELKKRKYKPTIKEGIEIIHACGGLAVWAHPFEITQSGKREITQGGKKDLTEEQVSELLENMWEYDIDGLEV